MTNTRRAGKLSLTYFIVTFFVIFTAFPFMWMIITLFKTSKDLYNAQNNPFIFNEPPTLDNLNLLFGSTGFPQFIFNSGLVGILVVLITLVTAVPAAYSLARLAGNWGETVGIAMFLVYLIPPTLLFIPMTRMVSALHLQNSILSLIVVYPTFTIPF